jgi:dimethylhistidine N-methyltransferase
MVEAFGDGCFNLIELGAGDGRKTKVLLQELQKGGSDFEYLPIDISEAALKDFTSSLERDFKDLRCHGVVGEYLDALDWIAANKRGRNILFFLGSNIGNFNRSAATVFLRVLWKHLNKDDLMLVGFDLKKDIDVLLRAYNDKEGVTRDFNLNLLRRINSELGGNFDLSKFQHFGTYLPETGAMESFLISREKQEVHIKHLEKTFEFASYEPIHTEYSYKYHESDIQQLCIATGFEVRRNFYDDKRYFMDSLWKVCKETL